MSSEEHDDDNHSELHNEFCDLSDNEITATSTSNVDIFGNQLNNTDIFGNIIDNTLVDSSNNAMFDSSSNVIIGTGGFGVDINFQEIDFIDDLLALVAEFDLTNALQIKLDVKILNNKLGLYKNSTNTTITSTTFDETTGKFPPFSIEVEYSEFITVVSKYEITSLGSFEQIYSDFNYQVKRYFHFPNDAILFDFDSRDDMNNNEFTRDELIRKFYDITRDENGNITRSFTGTFMIYDVNLILTKLNEEDPFSNRAVNNYTIRDGFVAGDKVLVIPGMTIDMGVVLHNSFGLDLQELSLDLRQCNHTNESPSTLFEKHYSTPMLLELVDRSR